MEKESLHKLARALQLTLPRWSGLEDIPFTSMLNHSSALCNILKHACPSLTDRLYVWGLRPHRFRLYKLSIQQMTRPCRRTNCGFKLYNCMQCTLFGCAPKGLMFCSRVCIEMSKWILYLSKDLQESSDTYIYI